jgi:HEAT repeat protein
MGIFRRQQGITLEAALRDLGSPDTRVRVQAADALAGPWEAQSGATAGADREVARQALCRALRDQRHEVRASAAIALGLLGDPASVPELIDKLVDGNPAARQSAAIALGQLGDPAAVAPLLEQLQVGPADLRFQAARSLAEIAPAAAFEPLCAALADKDPEVRESVAEALAVVGDARAAGWLAPLISDKRAATRFAVAMALATFHDPRGVDVLLEALGDDARAYDAVEGLELAGDPRAVPRLDGLARKLFGSPVVKRRAAAAINELAPGSPAAARARLQLTKGTRSRQEQVRGLAAELVERLETPS